MSDGNLIIRCDCRSPEHMIVFDIWDWDAGSEVTVQLQMDASLPFWRRAWFGLRYALTGKTQANWWADTVISDDDTRRLRDFLDDYLTTRPDRNPKGENGEAG